MGVGPGDPELITLKARRLLEAVPVICAPRSRQEGGSLALEIVGRVLGPHLAGKERIELHFPMSREGSRLERAWQEAAEAVAGRLGQGLDVAFVTLGDPTFYSTYGFLLEKLVSLVPGLRAVTVPGVTALAAGAARLNLPLVRQDERLAVVSGSEDPEVLGKVFREFTCTAVFKVGRHLPRLREILRACDLEDRAWVVERCGLPGESLGPLRSFQEADYLSLLVVRK